MRKKNKKDISSSNRKSGNVKKGVLKRFNIFKNNSGLLKLFGKIFVCFILFFIIIFSILVTAVTVYVMKATEAETTVSLERDSILGSEFTNVYGRNDGGKFVKLSVIDSGEKRIWVDISDVPQIVKDAVVSIEDYKFYEHDGVDFWRTSGAVLNMFLHFWKTNQGGSTITQQLLKNITGEKQTRGLKGISRKVKEICMAMALEKKYSKDQILQAYLNIIYVGNGNYYGIKTAAKLYFNKDLKKVNLQEAATLAALIRGPGNYNILKEPNKILKRRNYTLNKMYEQGKITKQECEEAKKTSVDVKKGIIYKDKLDENKQSYFVDTALNEVVYRYMKENDNNNWEEVNNKVKRSGFKIFTTVDIEMQKKLEQEYENLTLPKNIQSAFIVFDLNGNIKACVGGKGKKIAGDRSSLNYATNSNALISPGSTMKPLIYAYALEKNQLTYSSLFKDSPCKTVQGKPWPENFDGKHSNDYVTVKYAIQKSLNTVPTKILYDYGREGVSNFCDFLTQKLGIANIVSPKNPTKDGRFETSAMAMGSLINGVVISDMVNAFQIFANGGTFRKATTLERVENLNKEEPFKIKNAQNRVISKDTSVVLNRLLRNVVLSGGTGAAANLDSISVDVFGKTGTSNDGKNLMFIGGTPSCIAGIWFGSTNGEKIQRSQINPSKIWGNIMRKLLSDRKTGQFSLAAAKEQIICAVSGLLPNRSCNKTEKAYFKRDNFLREHCNIHRWN